MINHVTYHVPAGTLERPDLDVFMRLTGLREIEPNDSFEHGWKVRWFMTEAARRPLIHLVESDDGEQDLLALGHFCVNVGSRAVVRAMARDAKGEGWLERDSGSGRIWLKFANLRVEVRP